VVGDPWKKLRFVTGLYLLAFGPWLLIAGLASDLCLVFDSSLAGWLSTRQRHSNNSINQHMRLRTNKQTSVLFLLAPIWGMP